MKVNGYQLRETIKRWKLQRDTSAEQFNDSLHAFKNENKTQPTKIMEIFHQADRNTARVEEIQQRYNQTINCNVQGEEMTLALAVKLVGGAGRQEKMWRSAVAQKRDRYNYRDATHRSKDDEYAQRTISQDESFQLANQAAKFASALRNAISRANSENIELDSLGVEPNEAKELFE